MNNKLLEERGYANPQYRDVIKKIIDYASKYIINYGPSIITETGNLAWKIIIPKFITKEIDIVDNLNITLYIINDKSKKFNGNASGSKSQFKDTEFDDKLDKGRITVNGYSDGTKLYKAQIALTLSHELNHLAEEYYRRKSKKYNNHDLFKIAAANQDFYKNSITGSKAIDPLLQSINYRLLIPSELNALINSVYEELEGMSSERKNYKNDIKETLAYYVYNNIKNNKERIFGFMNDDDWKKLKVSYNLLAYQDIKNNRRIYVDIKNFKKFYKLTVNERLKDLIKGIGKIASYYYDETEKKEKINESMNTHNKQMSDEAFNKLKFEIDKFLMSDRFERLINYERNIWWIDETAEEFEIECSNEFYRIEMIFNGDGIVKQSGNGYNEPFEIDNRTSDFNIYEITFEKYIDDEYIGKYKLNNNKLDLLEKLMNARFKI